ncbi:hypothetical protein EYF80_068377 [Liparis tanakae]|uniref:Uncharacterized protein n=1 Tax=Liparis tanakae TaxID=230148 RepID=A0A4Z2DZD7_9TELE|nr:hypothetical protein EYF80_068377 [Liparis tanakae]
MFGEEHEDGDARHKAARRETSGDFWRLLETSGEFLSFPTVNKRSLTSGTQPPPASDLQAVAGHKEKEEGESGARALWKCSELWEESHRLWEESHRGAFGTPARRRVSDCP